MGKSEREERFESVLEEVRQDIRKHMEVDSEITYPLFTFTMYNLMSKSNFLEIITNNKVEPEQLANVIYDIYYAINGWYGENFEQEHKQWKDLYFDYVFQFYTAISERYEWLKHVDDDLNNITCTAIANILRAKIENLSGTEILVWLGNGQGFGYDVMYPNSSYVALREHLGISVSDPHLLNFTSISNEVHEENPERILADYFAYMATALDACLPNERGYEHLNKFRNEHKDLCNMLFGMGVMQTTIIPKHFELNKLIKDKEKLDYFADFIYNMLGKDVKASVEKTNDIKACKDFIILGVQVNAIAIDEYGSGLYGTSQGAMFDASLDMELEKND